MKNGILYVIDDDNAGSVAAGGSGGGTSAIEETFEEDEAYSAADLAIEGTLQDRMKEQGFFSTVPGYITIVSGCILILLLALFFLFFGVIVTGEVEEHDDVFELCGIRLMRWHDGEWCVNLGAAFDDNAVLKLRIGILFALIFEDYEITGQVKGMYEGNVTMRAMQNMLAYRKNIRRNV